MMGPQGPKRRPPAPAPPAADAPDEGDERGTKARLVDAAERLFATQGVAATSLRSITAEAGVNVAAVHYHFGSREALLRAVLARRVDPVNRERLRRLAGLEAAEGAPAGPPSLEALLEAFLAPAFEAVEADPELARVGALLFQEPREEARALVAELFGEVVAHFEAALARALPALPADELRDRVSFVVGAMVHQLAGAGLPALPAPDREARRRLARLVRFCAAGLRAPAAREGSR